ncbi:hypothetical protein BWI97_19945 [Siphonobacter sp. BAB-5405]|uniref:FecR family protein n=1 Tax=Siphonobacter sp. BAB-5405 TaxID=1864825 RepID=UPI000C807D0E|nr:FecR family protein [Siphonobacter sp. BAB-5405]PMD92372.1 hypothetical protein BWI97_19945 [Siphonobacter sp. BAB-5405]
MKKYQNFEARDFIQDESFRHWVRDPAGSQALFWQEYLTMHPEQEDVIRQARLFLEEIYAHYAEPVPQAEVQLELEKLRERVAVQPVRRLRVFTWVRWAAVLLILAGLGWWSWPEKPATPEPASLHWALKTNSGKEPVTVLLPDGSMVTLEKNSRLWYPVQFPKDKRAVQLYGDAFFDITKNPNHPFVVYTSELSTKVLGTSFWIYARPQTQKTVVQVRSGRVGVRVRTSTAVPTILNPQEQLTYDKRLDRLDKITLVKKRAVFREQTFDNAPVPRVLAELQRQFGVKINYNAEQLRNCSINTSFKEENLQERLSAICQAIGATYQVKGGQVFIQSDGCTP